MEKNLISRLRLMRDIGPDDAEISVAVARRITDVLFQSGFSMIDTPVIEQTDLFVRKSGGEIAGSLYSFTDPGGAAVSLRPEFTPSVIRWYIENLPQQAGERRYQYSGPVFRYGGVMGSKFRQFHQIGGELIGVPSGVGDVDTLITAAHCIESAGLSGYTIRVGHIGIIRELLKAHGLSEPLQMLVISNLDEVVSPAGGVDRLLELASSAGLIRRDDRKPTANRGREGDLSSALAGFGYSISAPTGRRTPEQIMARLLSRLQQSASESEFMGAVENVATLVATNGSPREIIVSVRSLLADCGASTECVDDLDATLSALIAAGVDDKAIHVDLSFVRGLDYYTGIVFEFLTRSDDSEFELGGGGRYDDLVRAFGGPDVPASGFALNVDEVVLACRHTNTADNSGRYR